MVASPDSRRVASQKGSIVWIPRFRFYTVFILSGLGVLVPIINFIRYGLKGDFWWVWNSGRWMAQHHQLLQNNPASWNGASLAGKAWVNLEWGWEWFIYAVNPHLHPLVFIGVLFAFEAATLLAFFWALKAMAPQLTVEAACGLYALYGILILPFTVRLRADLFSYAAFPMLLGIIWRARSQRRWLFLLAPLTLVWANIHGSWLIIPVLMALEAGLSGWRRDWKVWRAEVLWGIMVPAATAIGLTPWHLHTITYAWWLDHNRYITGYIQEWQSINFHDTTFFILGALVLVAWLWRARTKKQYPFILDLWFIGITLAFFDEIRMIPYFGMVFALWFGYGLAQNPRYSHWLAASAGSRVFRWAQWSSLVAVLMVSLVWGAHSERQWTAPAVPVSVVRWVNGHSHGVVLAPIDDGGYLEAHQVTRVFVDGRSDFLLAHGRRLQNYVRLAVGGLATPKRVAAIFQSEGINLIVWPKSELLSTIGWYMSVRHWRSVYSQGGWAVYAPPSH